MTIELVATTGSQAVDNAVLAIVGLFEAAIPGRLRSVYVEGSCADESAVATSDVDLIVLFKDRFRDEEEREAAQKVARYCVQLSALELDFDVLDEAQAMGGAYPMLKLGSRLLYGEDVRERVPLMPIEEWTRQRMHAAFWLMVNLFERPRVARYPLAYPDPTDEFFGYLRRTVRLADGTEAPTTRDLIRVTGWAATALVALKARRYVVRKRECYATYREEIGGEWANLLERIYDTCRREWNYLVPGAEEARQRLRSLCRSTLGFENHFLKEYQSFLVAELRSGDERAVRAALHIQGHTFLDDEEVLMALHDLARNRDDLGGRAYRVLDGFYLSDSNLVEDEDDEL